MKCRLCDKDKPLIKHHPIPRCVIKKVNPDSKLKHFTVALCRDCEQECHEAFILHLTMYYKVDGMNRFNALKYPILKGYLKVKHPEVWKMWREYWKETLDSFMKDFKKELEDEKC